MQSMQIPTDNLYKFISIFGLVIFITAGYSVFLINDSANQKLLQYVEKIESIESSKNPDNNKISRDLYIKMIDIIKEDKKFSLYIANVFIGISILMIYFGFCKWYKIYQQKQDKIIELSIQKIEWEIKQIKIECDKVLDPGD